MVSRFRALAPLAAVAGLATASACDCRDLGCASGIVVYVRTSGGQVPAEFSGELVIGEERFPFTCPPPAGFPREGYCGADHIVITRPEAAVVTVTVTSSTSGRFDGDVEPDYEDFEPEGSCGASCRVGRATVILDR